MSTWQYLQEFECQFVQNEDSYFDQTTIDKMFDCDAEPLWESA